MKTKILKYKWIIVILCIAAFLRLYKLDSNPPSLYWDEASIGYNAFSILTRGIDEHGVKLPVTHFLAYGDAKPPGYIYATVLSMAIFGSTEFAIRLPSALAGIIFVWLSYLLATQFAGGLKVKTHNFRLVVAALIAISPWHLHMSRVAYEANLALTFFLAGIICFFEAKRKKWLYVISGICFVVTWYTFNSYRIFLPLFLVLLGSLYFRRLWQDKKFVLFSLLISFILTLPLIPFVLSNQAKLRFEEVTIFKDLDPVIDANTRIQLNQNAWWAKIIYNRRILFISEFLDGFADHLKLDFLFFSGDMNPRLGLRDMGGLYLIELPLLVIGIFYLLKAKNKTSILLIGWWLLAIIPGAVARETPHALRVLQLLPVPYLIISVGIVKLIKHHLRFMPWIVITYVGFFLYYLNLYYVHYPVHWSQSWQYGYKELVLEISELQADFDRIYITDYLGRPHTNFLLYLKYDPVEYLQNRDAFLDDFGFAETRSFGKYYFIKPPSEIPSDQKWLYVSKPDNQIPEAKIKHIVYNLRGEPVFVVHE